MNLNKFQKRLEEAINDETAYKIVMEMVKEANPLVAVIGIHGILKKIRNSSSSEFGICNLILKRYKGNMIMVRRKSSLCDQKIYLLNEEKMGQK